MFVCHTCGDGGASFLCGGCKYSTYCGIECQTEDWDNGHEYACKIMGDMDGKKMSPVSELKKFFTDVLFIDEASLPKNDQVYIDLYKWLKFDEPKFFLAKKRVIQLFNPSIESTVRRLLKESGEGFNILTYLKFKNSLLIDISPEDILKRLSESAQSYKGPVYVYSLSKSNPFGITVNYVLFDDKNNKVYSQTVGKDNIVLFRARTLYTTGQYFQVDTDGGSRLIGGTIEEYFKRSPGIVSSRQLELVKQNGKAPILVEFKPSSSVTPYKKESRMAKIPKDPREGKK